MKNLKLLSKNYFLVILFSLFFGFVTNSQEPVDIWEVGEKKSEENTILDEATSAVDNETEAALQRSITAVVMIVALVIIRFEIVHYLPPATSTL